MQSKTSFFNKTLLGNTIKRFWPLWVSYAIVWIIILPLPLMNALRYMGDNILYANQSMVLELGNMVGCIMSFIFCAFAAMAVFNYLYSSKSAGMMAALPIKREGMFLTQFLAGLLPLLAVNIIVFLLSLGIEAIYGAVSVAHLLMWLAMVSMMNVLFFGFASFCAMLTGHLLVLPAVYFLLNFTVVAVEYIAENLLSKFVYGMSGFGDPVLSFLSPAYHILSENKVISSFITMTDGSIYTTGYYFNDWIILGIYCAVGLVLGALALLVYHRRNMETSSDVVAIRPLKPIFKYCLAGGCALVLGILIFSVVYSSSAAHKNAFLWLIAFMLIGGFIGYFAAEMLIKKSFRVWRNGWKGFIIFSVIVVALVCVSEFDLFGFEKRVPDPENIESVGLTSGGQTAFMENEANIADVLDLHKSIISHKSENEQMMYEYSIYGYETYAYSDYESYCYPVNFSIIYTLKNGKTMEREYRLYYSSGMMADPGSDVMTLNSVFNCQEAIESRKELDIMVDQSTIVNAYINWYRQSDETGAVTDLYAASASDIPAETAWEYGTYSLTDAEVMDLYYNCILPDISDGTLGRVWLVQDEDYYNTVYDCNLSIDLSERLSETEYNHGYFYTYPTVDSYRTNAWLAEHGIYPMLMGESNNIKYLDRP